MAARLNKRCAENVRSHIKTVLLVKRLQDHALGELEKPMTDSQKDAAKFLISQTMPKPAQTIIQDITNRTVTEMTDAEIEQRIAELSEGASEAKDGEAESTSVH